MKIEIILKSLIRLGLWIIIWLVSELSIFNWKGWVLLLAIIGLIMLDKNWSTK